MSMQRMHPAERAVHYYYPLRLRVNALHVRVIQSFSIPSGHRCDFDYEKTRASVGATQI